nr:unnamed protein product [Naegleria fowleri]
MSFSENNNNNNNNHSSSSSSGSSNSSDGSSHTTTSSSSSSSLTNNNSSSFNLSGVSSASSSSWDKFPRKSLVLSSSSSSSQKKKLASNIPKLEILLEKGEGLSIRKSSKATSSPFVVLNLCHDAFLSQRRLESSSVKNQLDPVWNEVFEFEVSPSVKEKGQIEEIVAIQVWHKGVFNSGVESFMGAANIPLKGLVEDHIHQYILDLIGVERGKIHLQVIPRNFGFKSPSERDSHLNMSKQQNSVFQLTKSDIMKIKDASSTAEVSLDTRKRMKKMQQYKIVEKLQKGGFGVVYKVIDLEDKQSTTDKPNYKAMKKIKCDTDQEANQAIQEVWYIRNLKHENLTSYDDMFLEFVEDENTKELSFNVCFVMPYYKDGDLDSLIMKRRQQRKFFSVHRCIGYMLQIAKGIEFLHSKRIIHRDLKHKNVFLTDSYNTLKLGDFGFSRSLNEKSLAYTVLGTTNYMAPEIAIKSSGQQINGYTFSADIWSFGVMCYELLTLNCGVKGFSHYTKALQNYEKYIEKILDDMRKIYGKQEDVVQFVLSLLKLNPAERPSAEECVEKLEEFYKKYAETALATPTVSGGADSNSSTPTPEQ